MWVVARLWPALLVALLACDDARSRACLPGDFIECRCSGGEVGYASCDDEGAGYGACEFCGSSPLAAGGAGGGGGGLLPFLSECATDDECDTGLCHPFNAKGPHCSHPCELDTDCEPPSTGCNGMGICKVP